VSQPPPLLTIAGSDSGGAAGLQADLKTWAALGVYGMSAITAVTAQNSARVAAVHYLPPELIAAQIDAVLSDYGAAAIKTGFLGQVAIIEAVADRLAHWRAAGTRAGRPALVTDPVLVNHRGEAMFAPDVVAAYSVRLLPLADLVTPNRHEAVLLRLWDAAGPTPAPDVARLLVKGMQRGDEVIDFYWDGVGMAELSQPYIDTCNTHGSGDTLSAAICAYVAQGRDWAEAIGRARAFTHAAIRRGAPWRMGAGHGPLGHA
jgi:hydroxymethylpyrimidine/phosphomethylpyrimidine kinase